MRTFWLVVAVLVALLLGLQMPSGMAKAEPARSVAQTAPWLGPPGSTPDDPGPSSAIFPPESLPLRAAHDKHVRGLGMKCTACHVAAETSSRASDSLLPSGTRCDGCHQTDHHDGTSVIAPSAPPAMAPSAPPAMAPSAPPTMAPSACATCHVGYKAGAQVPRVRVSSPNLIFSHAAHARRNVGCGQCHGDVARKSEATRADLPRMRGCLQCHTAGESGGDAKAACDTCHLHGNAKGGGAILVAFGDQKLLPPRWLKNAAHDLGFLARHKLVAANDSQFCGNCHREEFCTDCHDGRVRPRNVHPNDYISMHATDARSAVTNCNSCHREQSFCLSCHQRLGVAQSGPPGVREAGRFHPPKAIWSDMPRRPGHHAQEAARNLNACVSCHIERDCVACHGARGVGGRFSPHPPSFRAQCNQLLDKNPRPCLVCHEETSREISECR